MLSSTGPIVRLPSNKTLGIVEIVCFVRSDGLHLSEYHEIIVFSLLDFGVIRLFPYQHGCWHAHIVTVDCAFGSDHNVYGLAEWRHSSWCCKHRVFNCHVFQSILFHSYPYLENSDSGSLENWVVLHPRQSKQPPRIRTVGIPWVVLFRFFCFYRRIRFLSLRPEIHIEYLCMIYSSRIVCDN